MLGLMGNNDGDATNDIINATSSQTLTLPATENDIFYVGQTCMLTRLFKCFI